MHRLLLLLACFSLSCSEAPPPPPLEAPGSAQGDPNARPPVDPNQVVGAGERDAKKLAAQGPTVTLSGEVREWQPDEERGEHTTIDYTGTLRLEVLSDEKESNNQMLHSEQLAGPGPFTLKVPQDLGKVHLFAYYDRTGDGPSEDEPRGNSKPFKVKDQDIGNLDLLVGPSSIEEHSED